MMLLFSYNRLSVVSSSPHFDPTIKQPGSRLTTKQNVPLYVHNPLQVNTPANSNSKKKIQKTMADIFLVCRRNTSSEFHFGIDDKFTFRVFMRGWVIQRTFSTLFRLTSLPSLLFNPRPLQSSTCNLLRSAQLAPPAWLPAAAPSRIIWPQSEGAATAVPWCPYPSPALTCWHLLIFSQLPEDSMPYFLSSLSWHGTRLYWWVHWWAAATDKSGWKLNCRDGGNYRQDGQRRKIEPEDQSRCSESKNQEVGGVFQNHMLTPVQHLLGVSWLGEKLKAGDVHTQQKTGWCCICQCLCVCVCGGSHAI